MCIEGVISGTFQGMYVVSGLIKSPISVISMLVTKIFHLLQSGYLFLSGGREILYGIFRENITSLLKDRIVQSVKNFFSYPVFHGTFLILAGVSELFLGLHYTNLLYLGSTLLPVATLLGNGCFLMGNLLILAQNIRIYKKASQIPWNSAAEEKENAEFVKGSAVLSIISALSYIFGLGLTIIGGPTIIILLFAFFGLLFGGIKILYDIIYSHGDLI